MTELERRRFLQTLAAGTAAQAAGPAWAQGTTSTAVVYLSRSGNTRVFAEALARRHGAALHEIRPRDPWPADYEEMVDWATAWRESGDLLPLAARPDLSAHDTIFLCTPVWGGALPAPMRSALKGQELGDVGILPLVTHGGYGPGDTLETLRNLTPGASLADPFVIECDQERRQMRQLDAWLETVRDRI
jgi:hypothetical protein